MVPQMDKDLWGHSTFWSICLWGVITAKIKFGILLCCFPIRFLIFFAGVFDVLNDVHQNVAVVLLFLYSIIPTSMLLFVSVCCYSKPRCYYSCLYAVMRNLDAIIRVSNYVRLNPGLQRARPLWSGTSDKLIMPILPAQKKLCYSQWQRLFWQQGISFWSCWNSV